MYERTSALSDLLLLFYILLVLFSHSNCPTVNSYFSKTITTATLFCVFYKP